MQEDFAAAQRIDTVVPSLPSSSKPAAPPSAPTRTFAPPAKLEPYLLLAKSARGAGAANLIEQATAAPGVYCFGELLETKAISELKGSEQHGRHYELLELFAYGTLEDYKRKHEQLPTLNAAQLQKLRQLSLVQLASGVRYLKYDDILSVLSFRTTRSLESFLIDCIYSDLLVGRLNQSARVLEVESVIGRDVNTSRESQQLSMLVQNLSAWYSKTGESLRQLDYHIEQIRHKERNDVQRASAQSERVNNVLAEVIKKSSKSDKTGHGARSGGGGGGSGVPRAGSEYDRDMAAALQASMEESGGMDVDGGRGGESKRSPVKGGHSGTRKRTRA